MRGIVSLAAALALPAGFPYRDLILLTAFSVVFGTLLIHGLTLKPLLRATNLHDDDPVGHEVDSARARALAAGLAALAHHDSPLGEAVRREFSAHLGAERSEPPADGAGSHSHTELHDHAIRAAREAVLAMRATDEIGDDAFHQMEEELDWLEMAGHRTAQ
jgi:CPA1 family monovalent cation:H+ antiporter